MENLDQSNNNSDTQDSNAEPQYTLEELQQFSQQLLDENFLQSLTSEQQQQLIMQLQSNSSPQSGFLEQVMKLMTGNGGDVNFNLNMEQIQELQLDENNFNNINNNQDEEDEDNQQQLKKDKKQKQKRMKQKKENMNNNSQMIDNNIQQLDELNNDQIQQQLDNSQSSMPEDSDEDDEMMESDLMDEIQIKNEEEFLQYGDGTIGSQSFKNKRVYIKRTTEKVKRWTKEESNLYEKFIEMYSDIMRDSSSKRNTKIFLLMSKFIGTKTPSQCRSHHQKFYKKIMRSNLQNHDGHSNISDFQSTSDFKHKKRSNKQNKQKFKKLSQEFSNNIYNDAIQINPLTLNGDIALKIENNDINNIDQSQAQLIPCYQTENINQQQISMQTPYVIPQNAEYSEYFRVYNWGQQYGQDIQQATIPPNNQQYSHHYQQFYNYHQTPLMNNLLGTPSFTANRLVDNIDGFSLNPINEQQQFLQQQHNNNNISEENIYNNQQNGGFALLPQDGISNTSWKKIFQQVDTVENQIKTLIGLVDGQIITN